MHNYPYPQIAGPRRRHPARQIKQFSAVVSALAAPSVTATAHRAGALVFVDQIVIVDPPTNPASNVRVALADTADRCLIPRFDPV